MSKAVYRKFHCNSHLEDGPNYIQDTNPYYGRGWGSNIIFSGPWYNSYGFNANVGYYLTGTQMPNAPTISNQTSTYNLYTDSNGNRFMYKAYYIDEDGKMSAAYTLWRFLKEKITVYTKGSYVEDLVLDYGSVPENGRHTDGYWYEFVRMASPLYVNVNGVCHDISEMYVNQNGIAIPINEIIFNNGGVSNIA